MIRRRELILGAAWAANALGQDQTDQAKAFADSVLKLFDDGKYEEMYKLCSPQIKQQMTPDQWSDAAKTIIKQAGRVVSRSLANKTRSMGVYRFIYNTQRTEGKVFEDVTVGKDGDAWMIGGFYVRPNLE